MAVQVDGSPSGLLLMPRGARQGGASAACSLAAGHGQRHGKDGAPSPAQQQQHSQLHSLNHKLESWFAKLHHLHVHQAHGAPPARRASDQPLIEAADDMSGAEASPDSSGEAAVAPARGDDAGKRGRARRLSLFDKAPVHTTAAVLGASCEHIAPETNDNEGDKAIVDFSDDHRSQRVVSDPQEIEQYHRQQTMHFQTYLRAGGSISSMEQQHGEAEQRCEQRAGAVHTINAMCMLEPWFHCRLSREKAESMIKDTGFANGSYLVRTSGRLHGALVLSMACNSKIYHYPIIVKGDGAGGAVATLDSHTQFRNLPQLIDFYQLNRGVLPTRLGKYVTKVVSVSRYVNETFSGPSSL